MSVASVTSERLDDADYEAALERLRAFKRQLDQAGQHADSGSLERAADLAIIFSDPERRWVKEMDRDHPIKRWVNRGRPVDPEGRSRFSTWVKDRLEFQPRYAYYLLNAHDLAGIVCTRVQRNRPTTAGPLRPLYKLLKEERGEQAVPIWRRAVELAEEAGRETPSGTDVKKALSEHDRAAGYIVPRTRTADGQSFTEVSKRSLRDIEWIQQNGTDAQKALYIAELQKRLAGLQ